MKAKYIDIILDALNDYRHWFMDQGGNERELEEDAKKRELIDEAIKYIQKKRE